MASEKDIQLALREELFRLVSNITQLSESLGALSERVEEVYLNSNLSDAVHVKTMARDLIARAKE